MLRANLETLDPIEGIDSTTRGEIWLKVGITELTGLVDPVFSLYFSEKDNEGPFIIGLTIVAGFVAGSIGISDCEDLTVESGYFY